jgi:uncharacterized circularly permuted ATP-grasp superfamily protein/uncharacterized alpha-E superfamily protein
MPTIEPSSEKQLRIGSLLETYQATAGRFDESADGAGGLREAYRPFVKAMPHLSGVEFKQRQETARRIIQEQGVTYNLYGDPRGTERPWQLDLLPLMLTAGEWRRLETALVQRATLINRILADCYGAQQLIHAGLVPPALVFAQAGFLRPCHGLHPPGDTFLHLYAADLARSADGQWRVLSDRTQIPTGAGYALADRLIAARMLPEAFRDCRAQRLAGFFRELQNTLARLGSRRGDRPRVVLLTPGPFNETYFEQAWLARYLGYSLVEGQDLTVRDDRVFLKTLSGLEPVDVIFRRVDDDWCDPLELRSDSMLGVPGLVGALRAGTVAMANALGSGLLQSPAFMAFLPALCKQMLGEDLKLASVGTWWCGQPEAQRYVSEHLDELIVRSAFRSHRSGPPTDLPANDQEGGALLQHIQFQPHLYVAQERISLSTAPTWDGNDLAPRPVSLRAYVVATPDGYHVMPGGLTRVAADRARCQVSLHDGGSNKDTWVLADGPVEAVSLLPSDHQFVELRRVGNNLPSRLADNFFWMGRYCERADATARLLRSALLRLNSEGTGDSLPLIEPLLNTLAKQGQIPGLAPRPRYHPEVIEAELLGGMFDPRRRGSLSAIVTELQRLAALVRDRTSNDLWRVVTRLGDLLAPAGAMPALLTADAVGMLNQVLLHLAAFHGLARENMTRAQGWRFLDIGLRIERALYLCSFLDCSLRSAEASNPSVLEAVLEVADSSLTYRSRYTLLPNIAAVYDLVLLDDTNPRSLLFQLNQLAKHFERLPRETQSALLGPGDRVLLDCLARLRLMDPSSLAQRKTHWNYTQVGVVVDRILRQLPKLSDAIAVNYFAHSTISRAGAGAPH